MATDKPGVMTFLDPDVYNRLVAFKEKQRLRSLSHAAELALGEYFGVAITPITLHRASSNSEQPSNVEGTLSAKVDQLIENYEFLCQVVFDLQRMTQQMLALNTSMPSAPNGWHEHASGLTVTPDPLTLFHSKKVSTEFPQHDDSVNSLRNSADGSEHAVSAAVSRKGLTGLQLAERLNVHSSLISRKKKKSYFKEWTSRLDPIGLSWKYSSVTHRFHLVDR